MSELQTLKNDRLYDNCEMLHPNGRRMGWLSHRRADWYIRKGLAKAVQEEPHRAIQLKFEPKDIGARDNHLLSQRQNICVVCGSEKNLTRHHVVPYCYRRFFPDLYKSNRSYDILPVCARCHSKYEHRAIELKEQIRKEYNVQLPKYAPFKNIWALKVQRAANAIHQYSDHIPEERKQELWSTIRDYFGENFDLEGVRWLMDENECEILKTDYIHVSEAVVQKVDDLDAFAIRWREHFLKTMKPQHLPETWHPYRTLEEIEFGLEK